MPVKPFAIGIAILFLACAIWLVIGGVRRHRTRSLLRIPPILGCLAVVILLVPTIFGLGGPRSFFNKPAPVPASSLLFFNVAQSIVSRDTPTLLGSNPALLAVSAQTGKTLWQHSMQGQTFQTNDGRTVYTATSFRITYSSGSYIDTTYVAAFRATNGAILWQFWLYGTDITSPPVLANGILCLRVGHGGIDSSDSYGSPYYLQLLAVRALDGQQLWSISIFPHQGSSPNGLMSASAASNVLFVQPDSSTVQARRLTDGKLLWSRTVGDGTAGSIVAGPNGVYHYTYYGGADGGVVIALDARTGDELWRFGSHDFDIRTIRAVAVSSDTLYVAADYFTGTVVRLKPGLSMRSTPRPVRSAGHSTNTPPRASPFGNCWSVPARSTSRLKMAFTPYVAPMARSSGTPLHTKAGRLSRCRRLCSDLSSTSLPLSRCHLILSTSPSSDHQEVRRFFMLSTSPAARRIGSKPLALSSRSIPILRCDTGAALQWTPLCGRRS